MSSVTSWFRGARGKGTLRTYPSLRVPTKDVAVTLAANVVLGWVKVGAVVGLVLRSLVRGIIQ